MIKVSIHGEVEFPTVAGEYAKLLRLWKSEGLLPPVFGNEGAWEGHGRLNTSFVFKIHILLPGEKVWSARLPAAARKSNSYLVYSRHWLDPDHYQVISIMSPDAHEMARTSFLSELERRAEEFQNS